MFIEYTFKVNAFSVEKEVISVTYIPIDATLNLQPVNVQQLGVNKQILIDFSSGAITPEKFKAKMRKAIIDADDICQHRWNAALGARQVAIPVDIDAMIGVEWPTVTEAESTNPEFTEVVL